MAGAPSHLELFDYKPQLAKFDGTLPPAELLKGYRAAFINPELEAARARSSSSPSYGQCGAELSRTAAAPGEDRRRHRHRQVDGHRRLQPRARPDPDEHRHAAVRPAEHGRLGDCTAWAASRRTCPASSSSAPASKGPSGGNSQLGQRLPADGLPGRAVPQRRRPGAVPLESRRASIARLQRDSLDAIEQLNQMRLDVDRRSRDRHAHQLLRDGVPDASRARRS